MSGLYMINCSYNKQGDVDIHFTGDIPIRLVLMGNIFDSAIPHSDLFNVSIINDVLHDFI